MSNMSINIIMEMPILSSKVKFNPWFLLKRNMEKETNNIDPDPLRSQDLMVGFTQRKIAHDIDCCVYGYYKVPSEGSQSLC